MLSTEKRRNRDRGRSLREAVEATDEVTFESHKMLVAVPERVACVNRLDCSKLTSFE